MQEIFTEAIVLDSEPSGDFDLRVHLFTKELGRVVAKATSARKILSKLNPHLQPLNFVDVRLVNKNNFQIVDVLRKKRLRPEFWPALRLIRELTAESDPDFSLWSVMAFLIEKNQFYPALILNVLGYGMDSANCAVCSSSPKYFDLSRLDFFCPNCASDDLHKIICVV